MQAGCVAGDRVSGREAVSGTALALEWGPEEEDEAVDSEAADVCGAEE